MDKSVKGEGKMESSEVINELIKFRDARGWNKFHNLESLSRALNIEASEVEKIFLWKSSDDELTESEKEDLKFELADVLTYAYYMCEKLGVDPNDIVMEKHEINKNRHWKFGGIEL